MANKGVVIIDAQGNVMFWGSNSASGLLGHVIHCYNGDMRIRNAQKGGEHTRSGDINTIALEAAREWANVFADEWAVNDLYSGGETYTKGLNKAKSYYGEPETEVYRTDTEFCGTKISVWHEHEKLIFDNGGEHDCALNFTIYSAIDQVVIMRMIAERFGFTVKHGENEPLLTVS